MGLADANRTRVLSIGLPATEFFPKSKAAAQAALDLDDTLAEAHAALGFAELFYDWNWHAAEARYQRALELNVNSAESHVNYAGLLVVMGRYDEGLAHVRRARELDPLNLRTNALEGQFLILGGQPDEGIARLQKTIELEPRFFLGRVFVASGYLKRGRHDEAVRTGAR